jgi:glycosyltransferase involved in cell wall biosynthesis
MRELGSNPPDDHRSMIRPDIHTMSPTVSVILPTYNRASFLRESLQAIRDQQWTDWELIVVDDGSTDDTRALVARATADWMQPVVYCYQDNQGAYGARNTGLDHATGRYIAFYDSDDLWLPHHLQECVDALATNADVDWVYGSCRLIDLASGTVIAENCFYVDDRPRPFLSLHNSLRGKLHVIEDRNAVRCQVLHGLYCGLQHSVMRSRLFDNYRFEYESRNEAEDQLAVIEKLLDGACLGYLDQIHVEYRVHAENSSAAAKGVGTDKNIRIFRTLAKGFEQLLQRPGLTAPVRRAINYRLSREYFWHLGYTLYWMNGENRSALECMHRGIRYWPWELRYWKTYSVCWCRSKLFSSRLRNS